MSEGARGGGLGSASFGATSLSLFRNVLRAVAGGGVFEEALRLLAAAVLPVLAAAGLRFWVFAGREEGE